MRRALWIAALGGVLGTALPARAQHVDDDALAELSADVRRAGIPEPVTFDKRLAAGRSMLRKGRWLAAAEEFYEAARLSPAHPLPNFLFAHAMLGNRSWREAKDVLRKALGMYPRWRRLGYPIAQDFPASGDEWRAIVQELGDLRSRQPEGSPARCEYAFLLGYAYLGSDERAKARIAFTDAAKGPGAVTEARDYLEELTRPAAPAAPAPAPPPPADAPAPVAPDAPPATGADAASPLAEPDPFRRGNALVLAGRYDDAADAFLEAVIESPGGMNGILAHFELSHALFAVGRWSQAVTALRRGLRRYPDWPKVKLNRRDWYPADRPGDFEQHLRALETAAQAEPANGRLQLLLGYTAWFVGRRAQARTAFEAVLAQGDDADARRFLDAIHEAEQLIPDDGVTPDVPPPTPPAAPVQPAPAAPADPAPAPAAGDPATLGAERLAARDYPAAWAQFQLAVAAAPDDGELRIAASRAAFAAGDWPAAATQLRQALQRHPTTQWSRITGRWHAGFPDEDDYDARCATLAGQLEQLAHATNLDRRFLLAFAYLAAARVDQAMLQFRVLKHMDRDKTDAQARFFIDRLKVD